MSLLIGNLLAFFAAGLLFFTSFLKNKKQILFYQTINIMLYAFSNLVLGGITGFINNILNVIRNILCYKEKLNITIKIILTIITLIFTIDFKDLNLINTLPSICGITYLWFMDTKDIKKFKLLNALAMLFWVIYDFSIKSYVGAFFDFIVVCINIITCFRIKV